MSAPRRSDRIGALLPGVLKKVEQTHQALFRIQRRWARLAGKPLASHTRPVSLRQGRLVVQADRPGDGFALSYARPAVLQRIRAVSPGVQELIIRPGG